MTKTTDRTNVMSGDDIRIGMDAILTALPAVHVLAGQVDARLVVGPAGAFVLVPSPVGRQELLAASHRLDKLAGITREALCAHLAWIPFLDALIITSDDPPRSLHITSAALDLLPTVLTEGPTVIDAATIATIREVIRRSALDGWQAGIRRGDGKIDLCDPVQPTNAH